jgi:hypothetical protein
MTWGERQVYNEAQALYQKAKAKRDEAYRMQDVRLKQAEEVKAKLSAAAEEAKKAADRQNFSNKINALCLALGEAAKREGLTIDAGMIAHGAWVSHNSEKHIMTVHSTWLGRRYKAEIYAVANKGFRWEILES